jgi:hypothetical protein
MAPYGKGCTDLLIIAGMKLTSKENSKAKRSNLLNIIVNFSSLLKIDLNTRTNKERKRIIMSKFFSIILSFNKSNRKVNTIRLYTPTINVNINELAFIALAIFVLEKAVVSNLPQKYGNITHAGKDISALISSGRINI